MDIIAHRLYNQQLVTPQFRTPAEVVAWFGAVNQVVTRWVLTGQPERLEDAYPALRRLLLSGVGLPAEETIQ